MFEKLKAPRWTPPKTKRPFDIYAVTNASGSNGNIQVSILPGTLNGLVPTNAYNKFTCSKSSLYYVKLVGTSNGKIITSCFYQVDNNSVNVQNPQAFSLPAKIEILLGVISNGNIYQTGNGPITLSGHEQFRTDRGTFDALTQLNYIPYYVWA
jgi:hypothetical protein